MIFFVDIDWTLLDLYKVIHDYKNEFQHDIDLTNPYKIFKLKDDETYNDLIPDIRKLELLALQKKYVRQDIINYILEKTNDLTSIYLFTKRTIVTSTRFSIFGKEFNKFLKGCIQTFSNKGKMDFLKYFSGIDDLVLWFDDNPVVKDYEHLDVELHIIPLPNSYDNLEKSIKVVYI